MTMPTAELALPERILVSETPDHTWVKYPPEAGGIWEYRFCIDGNDLIAIMQTPDGLLYYKRIRNWYPIPSGGILQLPAILGGRGQEDLAKALPILVQHIIEPSQTP